MDGGTLFRETGLIAASRIADIKTEIPQFEIVFHPGTLKAEDYFNNTRDLHFQSLKFTFFTAQHSLLRTHDNNFPLLLAYQIRIVSRKAHLHHPTQENWTVVLELSAETEQIVKAKKAARIKAREQGEDPRQQETTDDLNLYRGKRRSGDEFSIFCANAIGNKFRIEPQDLASAAAYILPPSIEYYPRGVAANYYPEYFTESGDASAWSKQIRVKRLLMTEGTKHISNVLQAAVQRYLDDCINRLTPEQLLQRLPQYELRFEDSAPARPSEQDSIKRESSQSVLVAA